MSNLKPSSTNCPFCNGTSINAFSALAHDAPRGVSARVGIIECLSCHAAWQWPTSRSPTESLNIFNEAYLTNDEGSYFDKTKRIAVAKYQAEYLNSIYSDIPGKLLDLGCGDGIFAREMAANGWYVTGVDPALPEECMQHGIDRLLLTNTAPSPSNEDDLFNIVTLLDVIEHIPEPVPFLEHAISQLRPGGFIVIETGNYQSFGRINAKDRWWNYQTDHRWYFAPPQLKAILTKLGMDDIFITDKVLRPWVKQKHEPEHYGVSRLVKQLLKNPFTPLNIIRSHNQLVKAMRDWPDWNSLEIITLIARKPIRS